MTDGYRLTSNLLSTQDSSLHWSKRICWRSVSGPDTMPPTSSSDGSDAPSQRSQTFTDASAHCKFVFFHKIPVYVCFRILCTFFFFLPFFTVKNYSTGLSTAAWIFYQASINNSDVSIQFKPCTSIKYRKDMVMFKGALYWKACLFEYQKLKSCRPEKWETSPPLIHIFCMFQILRVSTTELNSSSVSQYRLLIAMKLWWK